MATIALTTPTTRLRLTARGRAVLTTLAAVPAVIAIFVAILSGGAAIAAREGGAPAGSFETVTVSAGESLWSIAQEVAPDSDPRDVVAAISVLNGLSDGLVSAGQRLAIPAEYSN